MEVASAAVAEIEPRDTDLPRGLFAPRHLSPQLSALLDDERTDILCFLEL